MYPFETSEGKSQSVELNVGQMIFVISINKDIISSYP